MLNKQESILYHTHQPWKYNASIVIDWLGIVVATGSFYYYRSDPQRHLLYLSVAALIFITSSIIALQIKCPRCGSRWFWQALKTPLGGDGLGKLRSQNACPKCGFGRAMRESNEVKSCNI